MSKPINVKQVEGAEVPVEILATEIQAISEGVRKLRAGRLNDKAIFLLVQHAAPKSLSLGDIRAVFDGITALEAVYLRKVR